MAFSKDDRVRITSKGSEHRRHLGTVEIPAAESTDGFNKVRLDGHPVGKTVNLADNELAASDFDAGVLY